MTYVIAVGRDGNESCIETQTEARRTDFWA